MTYKVDLQTIRLLAQLSNLKLSPEEEKRFLEQFQEVVDYISKIKALNTEDVEPSFHSINLKNVFQDKKQQDKPRTFSQKEALSNAKHTKDGYFVVPRILDK